MGADLEEAGVGAGVLLNNSHVQWLLGTHHTVPRVLKLDLENEEPIVSFRFQLK